jgi:hypothetical protein
MAIDPLSAIPADATSVVDSAPIIYFLKKSSNLERGDSPRCSKERRTARISIVVSAISLAEVIAGPLIRG